MGKAVKAVGSIFGGGRTSGAGAYVNPNLWNIDKEAKPFQEKQQQLMEQSTGMAQAGGPAGAEVLAQMGQAALGRGPSLAEAQLKAAQERNLAQQLAAARSGRGAGGSAMARGLMRAQGEAGRDLAQQAVESRLQERANFQNALAQAQQGARQDIGAGFELATAPKREQQQAESMRANVDMARTQARKQQQSQLLGGVLGAGASFLASDKRAKKNAQKEEKKYEDFLDKLQAYSYEYKNPKEIGASEGRKHGIMAQDLEKSEIGKSMVKEVGGTKLIDIASGFGAVLASQAELNKRLKKIEKKEKA